MRQPEIIPCFVELCAGLASVSGVLQHGTHWKPPISRMGRKTGYAEAILRVMGLRPRQGAAHYLWAEADPDVAALLAAYTQPDVMREIAEIIRSWIPCPYGPHEGWCARCKGTGRWDARDLWEVLRREKRRGLWEGGGGAVDTAGWSYGQSRAPVGQNAFANFLGSREETPDGSAGRSQGRVDLAKSFDRAALPWPPVLIAQDARIEPGEVAGWAWVQGHGDHQQRHLAPQYANPAGQPDGSWAAPPVDWLARRMAATNVWPPVHLTPDASIQVAQIPPGTVVYMDPPYANTTGYKHDLPRADVIQIAERWQAAGARVYISEAEPIAIPGWHHVDIGGERKGQARTFGHTQEWLTCSHPPAWTPPMQASLFGPRRNTTTG